MHGRRHKEKDEEGRKYSKKRGNKKENSSKCFIHGININLPSTQHYAFANTILMEMTWKLLLVVSFRATKLHTCYVGSQAVFGFGVWFV